MVHSRLDAPLPRKCSNVTWSGTHTWLHRYLNVETGALSRLVRSTSSVYKEYGFLLTQRNIAAPGQSLVFFATFLQVRLDVVVNITALAKTRKPHVDMTDTIESGIQDTDVEKLFRKGLRGYGDGKPRYSALQACAFCKYGAELTYKEELTDEDAVTLRRMFSMGPLVRKLSLSSISLGAFKAAFCNQEKCPSLKEVRIDLMDCQGKALDISECGVFENLHSLHLGSINTGKAFVDDIVTYVSQNNALNELSLSGSCGGDEGVATLIDTLVVAGSMKRFSLTDMDLSPDVVTGAANLLALNPNVQLVSLCDACPVEKKAVSFLLEQDRYAGVFNRLKIQWPADLLSELTSLVRGRGCYPELSVTVASWVPGPVLREFFDALAADTALRELRFHAREDAFDTFAVAVVSVLKNTTTLREISIGVCLGLHLFDRLIGMLNALKQNRSVSKFTVRTGALMPEIATSLSELLAVNNTLNEVAFFNYGGISPREVRIIANGLKTNYTLTRLMVHCYSDDCEEMRYMAALLERNVSLRNKAAEFVILGADVSDREGVDALRKVHSNAGFVEWLRELTGTRQEAFNEIQNAVLACSSA